MKKGFTLIELLAVVTILGILALIATPMILNVIEDTKKSAAQASANEYINGLNIAISTKELSSSFTSNYCTINSSGLTCSNDELEYNPKGTKPTLGYIAIENGEVKNYTMCINGYKITQQGDSITTEKDSSCFIEEAVYADAGLYRNGQLVYTWEELLDEGYIHTWEENGTWVGADAYLDGYLHIDDSIDGITDEGFANTGLTGVIIPGSVEYIGYEAFANNKISSLIIPDGVMNIYAAAFYSNNITSINIPASVSILDDYAFANNPLATITVDSNNPYYDSRNNCNAIIYTDNNYLVQGSRNTVIPDTVVEIAGGAFINLGLTSITIPNGVEYIGSEAFANNNLTSINIPASVIGIYEGTFANNPFTSITVDPDNTVYDSRDNCNAIIYHFMSDVILFQGSKNTVIPMAVNHISPGAFKGVGLTSISLPVNITYIGSEAFANNNLTSITLPERLKNIEGYAFAHNQLTSINIPASVETIYPGSFAYNPLTSITVNSNNEVYEDQNSNAIITKSDGDIVQGSRNTVISDNADFILERAFEGLGLTSITIKGTKIKENAFANNQLTSINIPESIREIVPGAFAGNPLTSITVDPNNQYYEDRNSNAIIKKSNNILVQGSRNTTIPSTVEQIGNGAFADLGITSITIPEGVWAINYNAFGGNQLTSVTMPYPEYWGMNCYYTDGGDDNDYWLWANPEILSNSQKTATVFNDYSRTCRWVTD